MGMENQCTFTILSWMRFERYGETKVPKYRLAEQRGIAGQGRRAVVFAQRTEAHRGRIAGILFAGAERAEHIRDVPYHEERGTYPDFLRLSEQDKGDGSKTPRA